MMIRSTSYATLPGMHRCGPGANGHNACDRTRRTSFEEYGPEARAVLEALLHKYSEHGAAQFVLPDVLKIPPISEFGNPSEIAQRFGGPEHMRSAVDAMTALIYIG